MGQLETQAQCQGFQVWSEPSRWNPEVEQWQLGLVLLARKNLCVRWMHSASCVGGQFAAVRLDDMVLVNLHFLPWKSVDAGFESRLAEFVCSLNPLQPWACIGDWNSLPSESFLLHATVAAVKNPSTGALSPTRWQGRRCIDYCVCNAPMRVRGTGFVEQVFGDHKPVKFGLQMFRPAEVLHSLPGVQKFLQPQDLTLIALWLEAAG